MGAEAIGTGASGAIGGIAGGIGGMFAAKRTKHASDRAIDRGRIGETFGDLEYLLLPYDELVRSGYLKEGQAYHGLAGDESRLGRAFTSSIGTLERSDPAFAAYRNEVLQGLDFDKNGIPRDLSKRITEQVRASQAARGFIDSPRSGIEEAVALLGGQEAIRSQRLAQVQEYLGGVTQGLIANLFPSIGTLYGGELQRQIEKASGRREAASIGAGIAS